jgi:NADPH2:quinone reductase
MSTIPESMQAVVCEEFAPIASLQLKTVPTPTAKAHEVLVKISSTGVNFPDGLVVQGLYQVKPPLPFIPGSEVSGEIVAVGDKVTHLNVGQQVIAWCMLGGFAEYVSIPATHVLPLPAPTDMDAIAGLMTAHATAQHG